MRLCWLFLLLIPCGVLAHDKDLNCFCRWSYSEEEVVINCTGSGPAILGSTPIAKVTISSDRRKDQTFETYLPLLGFVTDEPSRNYGATLKTGHKQRNWIKYFNLFSKTSCEIVN